MSRNRHDDPLYVVTLTIKGRRGKWSLSNCFHLLNPCFSPSNTHIVEGFGLPSQVCSVNACVIRTHKPSRRVTLVLWRPSSLASKHRVCLQSTFDQACTLPTKDPTPHQVRPTSTQSYWNKVLHWSHYLERTKTTKRRMWTSSGQKFAASADIRKAL